VSANPPGASWGRPAARSADANSSRGRQLREILRGRTFAYGVVLGSAAGFVAGAWLGSVEVMAGGPIAVIAAALALAFATADRRAERDFFRAYAAARGLVYEGTIETAPLTPLLGAGDRRRCEHWMRKPMGTDGLGHFVYEDERGSGRDKSVEKRRFTICVTDIEAAIAMFPGIFLCRRIGVIERIDHHDWLSHVNRHRVELESARLCKRYHLLVDDAQNELVLRELFSPSLEVLLAEHPLSPCFEYRAGTLVVYVERFLADEGQLDWLRDVTAKIAERFTSEASEASTRA
jgi:hypothetical protein